MSDRRPAAAAPGAESDPPDEPPPPLGSWPALYGAVIAELVLMIALCHGLSRWGR
jgi:hypothetical protein